MPAWKNGKLTVYHGTDDLQVFGIPTLPLTPSQLPKTVPFIPNLALCRPFTDFGKGFYVTTSLHQAKQWANARVRRILAPGPVQFAVVLRFQIDRDQLAAAESLVFVRDTQDYWDFVHYCRLGFPPHRRSSANKEYEVVYGPVALWPSQLLIQNCDQISFHMTALSTYLLNPQVVACATAPGGLF